MTERGRPRHYQDAEAFDERVEAYFAFCEDKGKMPTLSGISLHLGFCDRETFANYAEEGGDFARTVKRAKLRIEDDRNQRLAMAACTGVIFDLKHNHGWTDKSGVELTGADGGPIDTITRIELIGVMPSDDSTD